MFGSIKAHLVDQLQQIRDSGLYKGERVITTPYLIAVTETTLGQYRAFAEEVGEATAGDAWRKGESDDGDTLQLPVVNVSFVQAAAFCKWLNGRLPTESE